MDKDYNDFVLRMGSFDMELDLDETKRIRANKIKKGKEKVNKILESEEKKLVKDMIKTYDMSDPDSEEALAILREMEKDF